VKGNCNAKGVSNDHGCLLFIGIQHDAC
jgi:hypothetical protein